MNVGQTKTIKTLPNNNANVPSLTTGANRIKTYLNQVPKSTTVPPLNANTSVTTPKTTLPLPQNNASNVPPYTKQYENPQIQDWSTKQKDLFSQMENTINTPFTYDPNTDAALQSQKALFEAGAAKASQSAMETMNDRGILGSSLTSNQLAQIQQDANTQFNALIPQYQQQAYNQYQNNIANVGALLGEAYNLRNQQFNEGVTQAELTGSYLPPGAKSLVDNIYALKAQAESQGITAADRNQLSQQADQLRAQLTAMGVDVSGIGSNVALANAQVGQRTLQGQQMDYAQRADQRDFEYGQQRDGVADNQWNQQFQYGQQRDQVADGQWQQQFEYGQQRDQVADDQWLSEFNERVRQFGMNNAIDWAQQAVSQQNANVNSGQLALSREKFNYDKSQVGGSSGGSSGSSNSSAKIDAKQSYNNYGLLLDDMKQINNKDKARQLLEANSGYLSDSDYKKLADYINNKEW